MKNLLYTTIALLFIVLIASCEKDNVNPKKKEASTDTTASFCQPCYEIYIETFYEDTVKSAGYIKNLGTKCGKDSILAYTKILRVSCSGGTEGCPTIYNKSWYYQCGSTKVIKK